VLFNELFQFSEDGLSSYANSNFQTVHLDNGVCFLFRQTYNTESTAPRLKYLLLHRSENHTTELFSACQEVVSTNILKHQDIYV